MLKFFAENVVYPEEALKQDIQGCVRISATIDKDGSVKNVEVVDDEDVSADRVMIGSRIVIFDMEFNEELSYKIVGSTEANSIKGKISNESPVGKALIGAHVGDIVTVHSPAGESQYKVLEITAPNK